MPIWKAKEMLIGNIMPIVTTTATIAIFITTTQRFIMTGIITTMKDTQEIAASTPALGL